MSEQTNEPMTAQQMREEIARQEQAAMEYCLQSVYALLKQHDCEIVALPTFAADGRVTAQWGVRRVQR
jgi:hypothetical protein